MPQIKNESGHILLELPRSSFRDMRANHKEIKNADLRDIDLSLSDFTNSDLTGAIFYRSNLSGCRFRDCILIGAYFAGANLTGANFGGATISTKSGNQIKFGQKTNIYSFSKPNGRLCFMINDGEQKVIICGCFIGTLEEFETECKRRYPLSPIEAYTPQIAYLKTLI